MPKADNNRHADGADPRFKKSRPLSAQDLFALRDFIQRALSSLPDYPDNPLPLARLIEQTPPLFRSLLVFLSKRSAPGPILFRTIASVLPLRSK